MPALLYTQTGHRLINCTFLEPDQVLVTVNATSQYPYRLAHLSVNYCQMKDHLRVPPQGTSGAFRLICTRLTQNGE